MRTSELLENTAPGFWAWLGLSLCILLGIILALQIISTCRARKVTLEEALRRFPPSRLDYRIDERHVQMVQRSCHEKMRQDVRACASLTLIFLVAVSVFYHVGAWDIKTGGSSASKVVDKIEAKYSLDEVEATQGPRVQGREFTASDGDDTLSLDVSGRNVAFKNATGKPVNMTPYKRLTETEVIAYVEEATVLENAVLENLRFWQKMPSLEELEGTATDPLLVVKGTVNGQVVTVNISSENGKLTGTLAESSGRGFEASEVFR